MKDKELVGPVAAAQTKRNIIWVIICNQFKSFQQSSKTFFVDLHFYSPRAYEHVFSVFRLPHPTRSLCGWGSSVKCEPGFFSDVFCTYKKWLKMINNRDLFSSGRDEKKNIPFNKEDGCYQGFSNYGSVIICSSPDEVAWGSCIHVGWFTYILEVPSRVVCFMW